MKWGRVISVDHHVQIFTCIWYLVCGVRETDYCIIILPVHKSKWLSLYHTVLPDIPWITSIMVSNTYCVVFLFVYLCLVLPVSLDCFCLFIFVLCTLCCQFLWIVYLFYCTFDILYLIIDCGVKTFFFYCYRVMVLCIDKSNAEDWWWNNILNHTAFLFCFVY